MPSSDVSLFLCSSSLTVCTLHDGSTPCSPLSPAGFYSRRQAGGLVRLAPFTCSAVSVCFSSSKLGHFRLCLPPQAIAILMLFNVCENLTFFESLSYFFCPVCCSLFSGRRGNLITVSAGLQTVQVSWLECCWGYCEFCGVAMALYTNWVALHHSEFNKLEFWNNPGIRFWKITHPYLLQLLWLLMAAGGHWQPVLPLCLHLASDLCTWVQFPSCNGSFFEFESTPTHVISS